MDLNTNVVANIKRMSEIDNEMQAIKTALAKLTAQKKELENERTQLEKNNFKELGFTTDTPEKGKKQMTIYDIPKV